MHSHVLIIAQRFDFDEEISQPAKTTANNNQGNSLMHSLAPYSVRLRDSKLPGQDHEKFHPLGSIRGADLLQLIHDYLAPKMNVPDVVIEDKRSRVYVLTDLAINARNRTIDGFIESGDFGIKGRIVDVKQGSEVYKKQRGDADLSRHYFAFRLPTAKRHGIALFHEVQGKGIKTYFCNALTNGLASHLSDARLRVDPLTTDRAMTEWMKSADIVQIRLTRYSGSGFLSDVVDSLDDVSTEVIVKPSTRRGTLGKFRDYFSRNGAMPSGAGKLFSAAHSRCESIKVVAALAGRRRTFAMSSQAFAAAIEFDDDDVPMADGQPDSKALRHWAGLLMDDILKDM